jgi:hypothetical protein
MEKYFLMHMIINTYYCVNIIMPDQYKFKFNQWMLPNTHQCCFADLQTHMLLTLKQKQKQKIKKPQQKFLIIFSKIT